MKRCSEEIHMLKVDMAAVIQYWFNRVVVIVRRLGELSIHCNDLHIRGAQSLLENLKVKVELNHQKAFSEFSKVVDVPSGIQLTTTTLNCEDLGIAEESDSDTETDSDLDSSEIEL